MTVVVQPNVVTPDETAGVQTGELLLVTDDGPERLHAVERAYVARGGVTHIHYFAATAMDRPAIAAPAQWPSTRRLAPGDALVCEISASWWDHPGQVLRTYTVAAEATPLYRELHDVAEAAFDAVAGELRPGASAAALVEASRVIEDAGFTIRDDLVHGFVGGYLRPVVGRGAARPPRSRTSPSGPG